MLIPVAALVLALLVMSSDRAHSVASGAVAVGQEVIDGASVFGMPLFVLLSAGSAMLAFFSSTVLLPSAVVAWGEWTTLVLLWSGWLLGGLFSYGIGRSLGRPALDRLVDRERLEHYEERLGARAGFLAIFVFQLAMPSEIPGYVLGAMRYRFLVYAAALALAELPYAVSSVFLAESFLRREYLVLVAWGLGLIVLLAWAYAALAKVLGRERRR